MNSKVLEYLLNKYFHNHELIEKYNNELKAGKLVNISKAYQVIGSQKTIKDILKLWKITCNDAILKLNGILITTAKLFEKQYPNWCDSNKGVFDNLPFGRFIIIDPVGYSAIDNTTGDAWTEEFKTLDAAFKYLTE